MTSRYVWSKTGEALSRVRCVTSAAFLLCMALGTAAAAQDVPKWSVHEIRLAIFPDTWSKDKPEDSDGVPYPISHPVSVNPAVPKLGS